MQHLKIKELVAAGYAQSSTLPPAAAKLMRELATRLDVTFAALNVATQKREVSRG